MNTRLVVSIVVSCAMAGCGSAGNAAPSTRTEPDSVASRVEVILAHGVEKVPSDTIDDWVGYADEVVVIRILEESSAPISDSLYANGKGYLARTVVARVNAVVWSAGPDQPAHRQGETFEMTAMGWAYRDGEKIPVNLEGGTRLEVGQTYLAPLARFTSGWSPLSLRAITPLVGDKVPEDPVGSQFIGDFRGKGPALLGRVMRETSPKPAVASLRHLSPEDRYQASLELEQAHMEDSL